MPAEAQAIGDALVVLVRADRRTGGTRELAGDVVFARDTRWDVWRSPEAVGRERKADCASLVRAAAGVAPPGARVGVVRSEPGWHAWLMMPDGSVRDEAADRGMTPRPPATLYEGSTLVPVDDPKDRMLAAIAAVVAELDQTAASAETVIALLRLASAASSLWGSAAEAMRTAAVRAVTHVGSISTRTAAAVAAATDPALRPRVDRRLQLAARADPDPSSRLAILAVDRYLQRTEPAPPPLILIAPMPAPFDLEEEVGGFRFRPGCPGTLGRCGVR
jgi:hypothetical protein